jgi:lipoprotein-releasing system permease protein
MLQELDGVRHVQVFATKAGIIRTGDDIHGVIIKGVGSDFDWSFFEHHLKAGNTLDLTDSVRSDGVIVSAYIASKLKLEPGDRINMYFIQEPPRIRRFDIAGVYETGIEELDKIFILGDIRHIQRLNDWEEDEVGGIEVIADDYRIIPRLSPQVFDMIPYYLNARNIRQLYPQIFDWLALLDMNVYVILILMVLVAGINMITTLLIAVLEKTNLIGILKSLGAANHFIRKVFLYNAAFLISRGLVIGNLTGIIFCLIQNKYGLLRLAQESYYVSVVPVNLEWSHLILLNAGTFIVCMIMLIFPSYIVSRITPVKAMLFR